MPLFSRNNLVAILPPSLSFQGKTILITGGTSGLGLAAAIQYVQLNAKRVIITARDAVKGKAAKAAIETATANLSTRGIVEFRLLDMDTFASVKSFADELKADKGVPSIDVVLLNAGVVEFSAKRLKDGWETDLQVNTLSTTLLTLLLIPWMRSLRQPSQDQHIAIVGSRGHQTIDISDWPKMDVLGYWNDEKNYDSGARYMTSKLLLQYAAREIAKLVAADGSPSPIITTVCPHRVVTSLAHRFTSKGFIQSSVVSLYNTYHRSMTAEQGARALVLATTVPANENGRFVLPGLSDEENEKNHRKNMTNAAGREMQAIVWKEIVEVLEAAVPEVGEIVRGVN